MGSLTFDGCVETDKKVSIGLASEYFINDASEMLSNFGIHVSPSYKSDFFHLVSPKLDKEDSVWLEFFEPYTEKWYKLKELIFGFEGKVDSFGSAVKIFSKTYKESTSSKIQLTDLIFVLKKMKICDKYMLSERLGVGISILYRYIHILEQANVLERAERPSFMPTLDYFHPTFTRVILEDTFRNKIFKELGEKYSRKDLIKNLEICEETLKNWVKGKYRIPVNKLQKILTMLDTTKAVNPHIKSFNRLVFVYNPDVTEWKVPWRPWFNFVTKAT